MKHGKNPTRRQKQSIASVRLNPENWLVCKDTPGRTGAGTQDKRQHQADKKGITEMKIEYMLAFLGGVELMALANALSLGLLPCRLLGLIFMLAAFVAAALLGYSACYKHLRKAVDRRSYHEGVCKGIRIGRAERQSEVQRFLED